MVLYYNPINSMSMFPSGATHHRLHQSVSSPSPFNFTPSTSTISGEQQNCYSPFNSGNNSNSTIGALGTVSGAIGFPPSPPSQYSVEMPAGLAHPGMGGELLQSQPMPVHHPASWYPIPSTASSCSVRPPGSVVAGSPFDEWPGPNSGSPLSGSSPCISGSPVSTLPQCAYAMSMPSYGQPLQYHHHSGVHRSDHYSELHVHHPFHPHAGAGIPTGNGHGGGTPVHPSPDSGLTASSDGGTESPNGHHNANNSGINPPNGIKTENGNRPQPARSPYEWMKKPSYQSQMIPGKTRTKDKYRVVYSDHQRLELEKEFHYSRYITIRRKSELATTLGLSERQVKIWFQNRRAKERKQAKKREEIIRKEKDHHVSHVVHNHTPQLHSLHGLIN